jgi:hypothetical protein
MPHLLVISVDRAMWQIRRKGQVMGKPIVVCPNLPNLRAGDKQKIPYAKPF